MWRTLGQLGFSSQEPDKRAIERDEKPVSHLKRRTWPWLKKAQPEGRVIVFVDDSWVSERPTRVWTSALKGQPPVIQFDFNWQHLSMIARVSFTNGYFRLHEGSINSAQIVEFLQTLKRQIARPVFMVWDGLKAHRSRMVRDYVYAQQGANTAAHCRYAQACMRANHLPVIGVAGSFA